jgi:hypothetical protein
MPQQRGDGTFFGGVKDDDMGNTDQVPFYVEMMGSYQWGEKEDHSRRMVATAGKEHDRFTVQLTVFKSGRKASVVVNCPLLSIKLHGPRVKFFESWPIKIIITYLDLIK